MTASNSTVTVHVHADTSAFHEAIDAAIERVDEFDARMRRSHPRHSTSETRIVNEKTGGEKGQKPERYGLLPWQAMDEVARVYAHGAEKYADNNWRKGFDWSLSIDAAFRHMAAFAAGEDDDPESGLSHAAHATFHMLALITFAAEHPELDDRYTESKPPALPLEWTCGDCGEGLLGCDCTEAEQPFIEWDFDLTNEVMVGGDHNALTYRVPESADLLDTDSEAHREWRRERGYIDPVPEHCCSECGTPIEGYCDHCGLAY